MEQQTLKELIDEGQVVMVNDVRVHHDGFTGPLVTTFVYHASRIHPEIAKAFEDGRIIPDLGFSNNRLELLVNSNPSRLEGCVTYRARPGDLIIYKSQEDPSADTLLVCPSDLLKLIDWRAE